MGPRERYSAMPSTLESLFENTKYPFKLVVVEGGLPDKYRKFLETESRERGFRFIHEDYTLASNEAKNIGLDIADTEFVVFVDDDVVFTPGWLKPLVDTAKEFGASLVGPTIVDGDFETGIVHVAGGDAGFREVNGKMSYYFDAGEWKKPYAEVRGKLERGPATMLEFHVLLARRDVFDTIGKLDEELLSFGDFHDLVLSVRKAGGTIMFEPASVVAFHDPGTNINVLQPVDLPIYWLRWSDEWARRSVYRFAEKWDLEPDDPWIEHSLHWIQSRRRVTYKVRNSFGRVVGFTIYKVSKRIGELLESIYIGRATGKLTAQRVRRMESLTAQS